MDMESWLTKEEFSPLRGFSNRVAQPFGKTPPNVLTCVRFTFAPIVGFVLYQEMYLLGIILGTVMFLTDLVDGALARYQSKKLNLEKLLYKDEVKLGLKKRIFLLGRSHLGEELDAASDKVSVFIPLLVLGLGVVYWPLLALAGLIALALVLMRPIKRRWATGANKSAKSNRLGKFKVHMEVICLISLTFSLWLAPEYAALLGNITLTLAIIMAAFSLYGHISTFR